MSPAPQMPPLNLFNTLTRRKEPFEPLVPGKVGMYTCGPTVYSFAHLGNLRSYVFADVLRRTLEYNGFAVTQVMNITDVGHLTSDADTGEDKMEVGARREKKTIWEVAAFYTETFRRDIQRLNIQPPTVWCAASAHIQDQVNLIRRLEERGFAYRASDGIYFDSEKCPDYGKLARLDIAGLRGGARVEMAEGKRSPTDFCLWRLSPPDSKRQMEWDSPWGRGFPGWHIECSAMGMKYLGETFDIHTGGVDHIGVHHTNEIAQAECATGKPFVRYWLHGEFLVTPEKAKVAKSAGTLLQLQAAIEQGFHPLDYRYLTLTAHYRSQLIFTWESLESARSARTSLMRRMEELRGATPSAAVAGAEPPGGGAGAAYLKRFRDAVNDDLNMPVALAAAWDLMHAADVPPAAKRELMLDFDRVFGLALGAPAEAQPVPQDVLDLVAKRQQARQAKDWKGADALRDAIRKLGYVVEDTPSGPRASKA